MLARPLINGGRYGNGIDEFFYQVLNDLVDGIAKLRLAHHNTFNLRNELFDVNDLASIFRLNVRLSSSSGHPINKDPVSVRADVHCESTAKEIHT